MTNKIIHKNITKERKQDKYNSKAKQDKNNKWNKKDNNKLIIIIIKCKSYSLSNKKIEQITVWISTKFLIIKLIN